MWSVYRVPLPRGLSGLQVRVNRSADQVHRIGRVREATPMEVDDCPVPAIIRPPKWRVILVSGATPTAPPAGTTLRKSAAA